MEQSVLLYYLFSLVLDDATSSQSSNTDPIHFIFTIAEGSLRLFIFTVIQHLPSVFSII